MKIKSIYHLTPNAINQFINIEYTEKKWDINYYFQSSVHICSFTPVRFTIVLFGTVIFSSFFLNEEILNNAYLLLGNALSSYSALFIYDKIKYHFDYLPTVPFQQMNYVTRGVISSTFKQIQFQIPDIFNQWLKETAVSNEEEAHCFIKNNIKKGYCFGAVMSLMDECSHENFDNIKNCLNQIKSDSTIAIKKQILYLMSNTTAVGTISQNPNKYSYFFNKNQKQITKKLMHSIYGKSEMMTSVSNEKKISLTAGSQSFLKTLLGCITECNYLPVTKVSYQFLRGFQDLHDLLPTSKFFNDDSNRLSIVKNHIERKIDRQKKEEEANIIRDNYIKKNKCFFFDPEIGLFECNNMKNLSKKIVILMNREYPDYDLNNASMLIHIPIPTLSKKVDNSLESDTTNFIY